MNALLHIAAFIVVLATAVLFYDTVENAFLGFVCVVVSVWVGLLTVLAVWHDVAVIIKGGRGQEE